MFICIRDPTPNTCNKISIFNCSTLTVSKCMQCVLYAFRQYIFRLYEKSNLFFHTIISKTVPLIKELLDQLLDYSQMLCLCEKLCCKQLHHFCLVYRAEGFTTLTEIVFSILLLSIGMHSAISDNSSQASFPGLALFILTYMQI